MRSSLSRRRATRRASPSSRSATRRATPSSATKPRYGELKGYLAGTGIAVAAGAAAVDAAAAEPADCVMASIVGAAGLRPTFAAARQGRRVALANKECLVSAGDVFLSEINATREPS